MFGAGALNWDSIPTNPDITEDLKSRCKAHEVVQVTNDALV